MGLFVCMSKPTQSSYTSLLKHSCAGCSSQLHLSHTSSLGRFPDLLPEASTWIGEEMGMQTYTFVLYSIKSNVIHMEHLNDPNFNTLYHYLWGWT